LLFPSARVKAGPDNRHSITLRLSLSACRAGFDSPRGCASVAPGAPICRDLKAGDREIRGGAMPLGIPRLRAPYSHSASCFLQF